MNEREAYEQAKRDHFDHEQDCSACQRRQPCEEGRRLDNAARMTWNAMNRARGGDLGPMEYPRCR